MPMSDEFLSESIRGGGNPILTLMRVQFPNNTYYYADNTESITSTVDGSSQMYRRSRFEVTLPDDTEEGTPSATLKFSVPDVQIIRELRAAEGDIIFDLWLVLASNPNYVEYGPINYQAESFSLSDDSVSISLEAEPILHIQVPSTQFTPNTFSGLFK